MTSDIQVRTSNNTYLYTCVYVNFIIHDTTNIVYNILKLIILYVSQYDTTW